MADQLYRITERDPRLKTEAPQDAYRVLTNLLDDTGMPVLAMLSEKYGLRRVPGLGKEQIIDRLLNHLKPEDLERLENELITARLGQASIDDLLGIVLERGTGHLSNRPRMKDVSIRDAFLIESTGRRWVYTMRGHDVVIDLDEHVLACDCPFFSFAAKHRTICKHLATALRLVPPAYAREVLIDLAVAHRYGAHGRFYFEGHRAA
jgi:hypothetical protein